MTNKFEIESKYSGEYTLNGGSGRELTWADVDSFIDRRRGPDDTSVVVSDEPIPDGLMFEKQDKMITDPDSHEWRATDGEVVTLCDARMARYFPGATKIWVRFE